ncbi:MAG: undecaprenyl/decaprenyl-phosphate alpha-N-acetylglucosaminyl 1-phosphate transferase [Candidatus Omnitrophica bacterium]|nr:undecaprenyl/decaprenyl-phosphate alpha-N-acetylglucosaminyl 1-phosphate transferase [Candidatus Omnitrophota bacterium]
MWAIVSIYVFLSSLVCSYIFVGFMKKIALRFSLVDRPDFKRKVHTQAIPLLGGVGMFCAFFLVVSVNIAVFFLLMKFSYLAPSLAEYSGGIVLRLPQITIIILTALIMVILGFIDDVRGVKAIYKLIVQLLLSLAVFFSGIKISLFIGNNFVNALLTVVWIIGITNAFNLMDNMDGLSCGSALISSLIFFMVAFSGGHLFVALILAVFTGVLSGFFPYNFPPAKMFMGDAGSLFIGYVLSLLTIINTYYSPAATIPPVVIMPLLILAIPIFDTFSVIYIRLRAKVSIFTADQNHLSHRMVNLGMSQKQAVFFIYLANFCIGLGALLLVFLNFSGYCIVLLQAVCILMIIVLLEKTKK